LLLDLFVEQGVHLGVGEQFARIVAPEVAFLDFRHAIVDLPVVNLDLAPVGFLLEQLLIDHLVESTGPELAHGIFLVEKSGRAPPPLVHDNVELILELAQEDRLAVDRRHRILHDRGSSPDASSQAQANDPSTQIN